jgi:hypothetical protein
MTARTKKLCIFAGLAVFLASSLSACRITCKRAAADELDRLRDLWRRERYREAFDGLTVYRKSTPYGNNAEVLYMIGTSLCRTPQRGDLGKEYLQWILDNQPINHVQRQTVVEEQAKCVSTTRVSPVVIVFRNTRGSAGMEGHTKMFHGVDENAVLTSKPIEVIREIRRDVITARLYGLSDREKGKRAVGKLLGPRATIETSKHFILASSAGRQGEALRQQLSTLENVYDFFIRQYQMRAPQHLIVVYQLRNADELIGLAETLHGIRPARNTLGYSFQSDMSMLAWPDTASGTLLHELFHLMVRNNFGDIPPWMDEGMAALYEVCTVQAGRVRGVPNWRGKVLERLWSQRPTIEELVSMDWSEFDCRGDSSEGERQAVNHAMARYFALYLQHRNLLRDVYGDFRTREIGSDPVRLLEQRFPRGLAELDRDFARWFEAVERRNTSTSSSEELLEE